MADYRAGRVPDSIAQHERVAVAYGNPSLNLAREVTDRIDAGEFTWAENFKNLHPSPFGHQLYANSVARMLDAAFAKPIAASTKEHPLPAPLDAKSYAKGRLGDIAQVRLIKGFQLVKSWTPPADEKQATGKKVGTREGFVNVPALVGTELGAEFEFSFEGTGCGLFIASGPDAGHIDFSIDGGPPRTLDTMTRFSSGLHLPRALILDDQLESGSHTTKVRITTTSAPKSTGTALRVFHLLLN